MSANSISQLPTDGLVEIALAGRSNVGKSSMINRLVGKRGLARTSNTPGRTQSLNYYRIYPNGKNSKPFYFVDMPGYGYAEVNKQKRGMWAALIEKYLSEREELSAVIQLVDLRHPPQPLDIQMAGWLTHFGHNFLVVGTKADKIAKTRVDNQMLLSAEQLNVDSISTVSFSAQTGLNSDKLWKKILELAGHD